MKITTLMGVGLAGALCAVASAGFSSVNFSYGWEDGGTIIGQSGNLGSAFSETGTVFNGSRSLGLTEDPVGGTPEAWLAQIGGLQDGDIITASFWAYDVTPDAAPSLRIWGHYSNFGDTGSDVGSAGGNNTFSGEFEWTRLEHTWTFDSNGGTRDALTIQARLYSSSSSTPPVEGFFVDDLEILVERNGSVDGIDVILPVPAPGALALLGLAGIAARRRRA